MRGIIESIIENGYVVKPYIGVSVTDVSTETQGYGLPQGAAVKAVDGDSPAEKAGLQINDIITQAGGTQISGSSDLVSLIRDCEAGDELELTVYRQGENIQIKLTVGEKIQSAADNTSDTRTQQQTQQFPEGIFPWAFGGMQ